MFAGNLSRNLSSFGALVAAMLASTAALAQISDDVVKIGVLTDMNGPASTPTGQGSVTAAQMAVDDFGGKVLGKPINVIVGDHQLKPDIGGGIARRWYDVDQVDLIVDVPVSAVGLAVQNVANEKKKLFIAHSTGSGGFPRQVLLALRHPVGVRHPRARGRHRAGSRQARRRQLVLHHRRLCLRALARTRRVGRDHQERRQGARLGQAAVSRRRTCRRSSCRRRPRRPRSSALPPGRPTTPTRSRLAGEFGIFKGGQQMAGLLVLITDIHSLGLHAAQGLLLTTSFYWDMDDKTREWSKRYFAKMNRMPTMWQAGVYSSVTNYLNAIKASAPTSRSRWRRRCARSRSRISSPATASCARTI